MLPVTPALNGGDFLLEEAVVFFRDVPRLALALPGRTETAALLL